MGRGEQVPGQVLALAGVVGQHLSRGGRGAPAWAQPPRSSFLRDLRLSGSKTGVRNVSVDLFHTHSCFPSFLFGKHQLSVQRLNPKLQLPRGANGGH